MQVRPAPEKPLPPRRAMRPWVFPVLLATILALLLAGYTAWWLSSAERLREAALDWIEQRRAEGFRLDYGPPVRVGFPASVGVRFPDAEAATPGSTWHWQSADVRLSAPLIGRKALTLRLEGEQALAIADAGAEGGWQRWTGGADLLSLTLEPGDGALAELSARKLTMNRGNDGFGAAALDARVYPPSAGDDDATGGLTLAADRVRLTDALATPLARDLSRLELAARLIGNFEPPVDAAARAAWRDAGGIIEIDRLLCEHGPVSIEASGTLALDRRGQPMGALATRVRGWQAALDALAEGRVIPAYTAAAAKILLREFARGDNTNGGSLAVPLSVQDQTLSVGPVPLLRVPDVRWLGAKAG
jgi:hypothetical protein